ncbi:MAG: ABC transporter permease [Rhodothermales bacterium]
MTTRTNLRIQLRHARKNPLYGLINIGGLALGMACFMVLGLCVYHEWSYERFHENADRIVRVTTAIEGFGEIVVLPAAAVDGLTEAYPAIEDMARFYPPEEPLVVRHQGELQQVGTAYYADPSMFAMFSFQVLEGDPETMLVEPNTVVLSASTARRYFGDADPIGQVLERSKGSLLRVVGVLADAPSTSHLDFDMLLSFSTLPTSGAAYEQSYGLQSYIFALLRQPNTHEALTAAVNERLGGDAKAASDLLNFGIQGIQVLMTPLTAVHFSGTGGGLGTKGDKRTLWLFIGIGVFILVLACINYMNLATARYTERQREVGVRKALGARRGQLVTQFLGESLLLSGVAAVLALGMVEVFVPQLEALFGFTFPLNAQTRTVFAGLLGGLALAIGLIAGSYPAFFLSRFDPVSIFRGGTRGVAGVRLRRILVTVQFAVSAALIFGTLVLQQQLRFLQNTSLGFDTEQIVRIKLPETVQPQAFVFKHAVERIPAIETVSVASGPPNRGMTYYHDDEEREGEETMVRQLNVDADYLATMGMTLLAGRDFDATRPADTMSVLVNETWVRHMMQLDTPEAALGETLGERKPRTIIGVVSDFHALSLRDVIIPTRLHYQPERNQHLVIRVAPDQAQAALVALADLWPTFVPDAPFEYRFLDQELYAQYHAEQRLGQLFTLFTVLALFIAALGLFGLAAFTAARRTREIGVRKVLGATVTQLVSLLFRDFAVLVVWAAALALPFAYYGMQVWLQDFAYRIDLHIGYIGLAILLTFGLALGTVLYQAVRAARSNPAEALRTE